MRPLRIAVTGAAGQIGYSLLFRLAAGDLCGDRPIELRLLEVPGALKALEGVVMELDDCAFPALAGVEIGSDPRSVFDGANLALLVGAMPRKAGMSSRYPVRMMVPPSSARSAASMAKTVDASFRFGRLRRFGMVRCPMFLDVRRTNRAILSAQCRSMPRFGAT